MKRFAVLVGILIAAGLTPSALAQSAASITEVGWWTRQPNAQPTYGGGFEVARTPDGDFSVAAARVRVEATAVNKAVLILSEADGVRADSAALKVCPTSAAWSAANPGAMSAAPAPGCDRGKVPVNRNADAKRWTADVSLLLVNEINTSLMILPDSAPGTVIDPGFQVRFSNVQIEAEGVNEAPFSSTPVESGLPASTSALSSDVLLAEPDPASEAPDAVQGSSDASLSEQLASGAAPRVLPRSTREIPWVRLFIVAPLSVLLGGAAAFGRRLLNRAIEPVG